MHRWITLFLFFLAVLASAPGSFSAEDQGSYRFEQIGPYGGDVRALLIDAKRTSVSYLGSSNGRIYKTVDAGHSWFPLKPGIGRNGYVVDTLVQHPDDPDHLYAGAWDLHSDGGGLFQSLDGGTSWDPIKLPQDSSAVRGFAVCNSDPSRMLAGTLTGVFVSRNGGLEWEQAGDSMLYKAESVAMDPVDCSVLYVGTWRLGYRSDDFGKTWKKMAEGMPLDSDIFSIALDPRNPKTLFAGACSGVYRSGNRATAWTRLKLLSDRFTIRAHILLVDPVLESRVYAGTTEGLFVSNDNGLSWRLLTQKNVSVNAIQVDPTNNRRILVGTEYRGVLRSEDGGRSWKESNDGFIHQKISWIVPDPEQPDDYIMGVHSGEGGLYVYNSKTRDWNSSSVMPGTRVFSYLVLPEGRGRLAGTSQGVYWQSSRSSQWEKLEGLIADRTVYSLAMDATCRFVFAGTDYGIYRTSIETLKFRIPPSSRMSPKVWCILAPESDKDTVYAGTSLGLLRSWDKGTTWHILSASGLPARAIIRTLEVSPEDTQHLFAATSAGLLESMNGGVHWQRTGDGGLGIDIASVLFVNDSGDTILAADKTDGGVFKTEDGGQTWIKLFSSDYDSPVNCILKDPLSPLKFFIGTQSDGVYSLSLQ